MAKSQDSTELTLRDLALILVVLYTLRVAPRDQSTDETEDMLCRHVGKLLDALPEKLVILTFNALWHWATQIECDGLAEKLGRAKRVAAKAAKQRAKNAQSRENPFESWEDVVIYLLVPYQMELSSAIYAAALLREIAVPREWNCVRHGWVGEPGKGNNTTLGVIRKKQIAGVLRRPLKVTGVSVQKLLDAFCIMSNKMAGAVPDRRAIPAVRNRPAIPALAPEPLGDGTDHDRICIEVSAVALIGALGGDDMALDKALHEPKTSALGLFMKIHAAAKRCDHEVPNILRFALVHFSNNFLGMPERARRVDVGKGYVSPADWAPLDQKRLNSDQLARLVKYAEKLAANCSLDQARAGLRFFGAMNSEGRREVFLSSRQRISQLNLPESALRLWNGVHLWFG